MNQQWQQYLIDTGVVIDLVQRRPCLWDTTHPDYKDKQARTRSWEEICDEMFENLTPEEKDTLSKNIQQRWRTARDTYIKYKGSKGIYKPNLAAKRMTIVKTYAFAEKLRFLDSSEVEGASSPSSVNCSQINVPEASPTKSQKCNDSWTLRKKRRRLQTQAQPTATVLVTSQPELDIEIDPIPVPINQDLLPDISSDDMAFFQSLGPIIRNFTMHQKLLFRSEVLNSAMSILSVKHKTSECLDSATSILSVKNETSEC